MPVLSKGDYIQYYWTKDTCHRGEVDSDGYRLFFVVSVGPRWYTLLHTSNLARCRISRTVDLRKVRFMSGKLKLRLASNILNNLKVRQTYGYSISADTVRRALQLLEQDHEPVS